MATLLILTVRQGENKRETEAELVWINQRTASARLLIRARSPLPNTSLPSPRDDEPLVYLSSLRLSFSSVYFSPAPTPAPLLSLWPLPSTSLFLNLSLSLASLFFSFSLSPLLFLALSLSLVLSWPMPLCVSDACYLRCLSPPLPGASSTPYSLWFHAPYLSRFTE